MDYLYPFTHPSDLDFFNDPTSKYFITLYTNDSDKIPTVLEKLYQENLPTGEDFLSSVMKWLTSRFPMNPTEDDFDFTATVPTVPMLPEDPLFPDIDIETL